MCELFAMSSRNPTMVGFSLERLVRRGGAEGPHRDGWGVAFFAGNDASLLREPNAASDSALARCIEHNTLPSELVISHIRLATRGERALRNTQPFARELGGRTHVFAHNGELDGLRPEVGSSSHRFRPVGETDSEAAFCQLLMRLAPLWDQTLGVPALSARLDRVTEFAAAIRPFGPANFLYADSDALFVHAHQRTQPDGNMGPPGLYVLERNCWEGMPDMAGSGITLSAVQQALTLVATVPLTDESWRPMAEGEVLAIAAGRIVDRRPG